jgi:hypothetical protein
VFRQLCGTSHPCLPDACAARSGLAPRGVRNIDSLGERLAGANEMKVLVPLQYVLKRFRAVDTRAMFGGMGGRDVEPTGPLTRGQSVRD